MPYVQLESGTVLETDDVSLWPEAKRLSKAKGKAAMREFAFAELHKILRPGDEVICVLRDVSRSGMTRKIDFYANGKKTDVTLIYLTQFFAWLLDEKVSADQGMIVGGCGMDMGFHIVYNASSALWPKGFKCVQTKTRRCPSNDHSNRDERKHHPDGGYALKHRWL